MEPRLNIGENAHELAAQLHTCILCVATRRQNYSKSVCEANIVQNNAMQ